MKAKKISLAAIVFACVWVGALLLAKAVVPVVLDGRAIGLSVPEIIASGAFFVVACTPVYRSIWLDKQLGIAASDDEEQTEAAVE
ncbi:MAG: hypothetical protein K2H09_07110 [Treponemataceae bacterium]|nr:hypothetical protein [Treponemataceae bacterium]